MGLSEPVEVLRGSVPRSRLRPRVLHRDSLRTVLVVGVAGLLVVSSAFTTIRVVSSARILLSAVLLLVVSSAIMTIGAPRANPGPARLRLPQPIPSTCAPLRLSAHETRS